MVDLALAIEPAARDWIRQRGGAVTLRATPHYGCCGGMARVPAADPGVPDDAAEWESVTVDGVSVRLDPMLAGDNRTLTIRVEGFLGWRRLFVEEGEPLEGSVPDQSM
mgnify:CR=1 FL=1